MSIIDNYHYIIVVSDAIIFTIIVLADVSLLEWIYPFIFYIQVGYIFMDYRLTIPIVNVVLNSTA